MGNPYFKHSNPGLPNPDWNLYRNACDEIAEIFGSDLSYITKDLVNPDYIFGESTVKDFNEAFTLTFYIENYLNYEGGGDFFSKFSFQVDNQLIIAIAQERFDSTVGAKPQIDDLIMHPMSGKVFSVKNIDYDAGFFQFYGSQMIYRLTCHLLTPSHEEFNTSVPEVDILGTIADSNNDLESDEISGDTNSILDFNEKDIFNNI